MFIRIETIPEKKLLGKRMSMSLAENTTPVLWKSFIQQRSEIQNNVNADLISMQVYNPPFDPAQFNMQTEFEKWAVTEVTDFDNIPEGIEAFTLPGGMYAVFLHKGAAAIAAQTFQYIFGTWLPQSGYSLDARPHFELLGDKYKNNDPESEEEIWIPVRGNSKT